MACIPYTKTDWVNGTAPAINADNLNNIERGIEDVTNCAISHEASIINLDAKVLALETTAVMTYDATAKILYVTDVPAHTP